jgi:hypothetical protein
MSQGRGGKKEQGGRRIDVRGTMKGGGLPRLEDKSVVMMQAVALVLKRTAKVGEDIEPWLDLQTSRCFAAQWSLTWQPTTHFLGCMNLRCIQW